MTEGGGGWREIYTHRRVQGAHLPSTGNSSPHPLSPHPTVGPNRRRFLLACYDPAAERRRRTLEVQDRAAAEFSPPAPGLVWPSRRRNGLAGRFPCPKTSQGSARRVPGAPPTPPATPPRKHKHSLNSIRAEGRERGAGWISRPCSACQQSPHRGRTLPAAASAVRYGAGCHGILWPGCVAPAG